MFRRRMQVRDASSSPSAGRRNSATGERGENIAVAYLKGKNFRIIERNFRCRVGEIDIIASDGKTLVFIEVKTRRHSAYGDPQLAVTQFKQRQISKAALLWLSTNGKIDCEARFDVVAVLVPEQDVPVVEHIRNAFDLAY